MTSRNLPAFTNEAEEANWWYENREKHAEEFIQAFAEGRVRRGGMARLLAEAELASTVAIAHEDALNASRLAEKKGVEVKTYLANLLHTALQHEWQALQAEAETKIETEDAA